VALAADAVDCSAIVLGARSVSINADTKVFPNEIITAGRWHSALFMSFALSFSFFEAVPLIALRKGGCRSVAVLADLEGYRVSISEAGISQVGRTYELGPAATLASSDGTSYRRAVGEFKRELDNTPQLRGRLTSRFSVYRAPKSC
jgi:hypothetical protein